MTTPFTYEFAPLEDTSDVALRELCWRHGADVTYTEMARTDSLARGNKSTLEKTRIEGEHKAWIQITPGKDQALKRYLTAFTERGAPPGFLGFNFNLGCPSPHLIRDGLGCAMVKRVSKTQKMVDIVRSYGYPVSIKIRLGLNKTEKERKVYLNLIDAVDADAFIVHARVGSDTYATPADYAAIKECVDAVKKSGKNARIIANGDIHTKEQVQALKAMGCSGVMIGRAAVFDPAIFDRLKGKRAPSTEELLLEYKALCEEFPAANKYRKNLEKRLGRPVTTIAELWNGDGEQDSVMG